MTRFTGLENLSYAELEELHSQVDRMMVEKQHAESSGKWPNWPTSTAPARLNQICIARLVNKAC